MMGAWGKFAREGSPGSVAGTPWPPFSRQAPHTMVLDSGEFVRIEAKELTLDALLQAASAPSPLSAVERCLLTWELLINIGRPNIQSTHAGMMVNVLLSILVKRSVKFNRVWCPNTVQQHCPE